jgi:hypothetical protein
VGDNKGENREEVRRIKKNDGKKAFVLRASLQPRRLVDLGRCKGADKAERRRASKRIDRRKDKKRQHELFHKHDNATAPHPLTQHPPCPSSGRRREEHHVLRREE